MDEIQTWWEVPTVALFCDVFRKAFNLFYIDIGELEAAILDIQDPEMCLSLKQLIIKILEGCYEEGEVTSENWEERLEDLFDEYEKGENPFKSQSVMFMSPRSKVEILLKLCEYRIDAGGDLDTIKDIPSEKMQAQCVGKDSQNNTYWYFCDERLYKELPKSAEKSRKRDSKGNTKDSKPPNAKSGTRTSKREKKTVQAENSSWSVECYNISEWEELSKKFMKSKKPDDKELGKIIKNKYIPLLTETVAEKDRRLRKRFLELMPKRSSSRLCKVQAQKKLEEQMAAEAEETRVQEEEEQKAKQKDEKNSRRRRAEERERRMEEQSFEAQTRDLMSRKDYFEAESSKSKRELSPDENSSSNPCDKDSSSEEESENDNSRTFLNIRNSSVNGARQNAYGKPRFVSESQDVKKWKLDPDEVNLIGLSHRESHCQQPFRQRNLNSCNQKITGSSSVIRLDFIKPSNAKLSS